jgi:PIN domain nuclease of toxin-antitoxin system
MKYLLDTCTFLWLAQQPEQLSERVLGILKKSENTLYVSVLSAAEISHKYALGHLPLPVDPDIFVLKACTRFTIQPLPLFEEETFRLSHLPFHHRDPFDRLLVCQAQQKELTILTPDSLIAQYDVETIW